MSLQQVNLHLDEGHLVLGQDLHQGSIRCCHLATNDRVIPNLGLCAVEVEATHVHEGSVNPAAWARATVQILGPFMVYGSWSLPGSSAGSADAADVRRDARSIADMFIPDICHEHHERRSCKFFLAVVNFYRFDAKNWHFDRFYAKSGVFYRFNAKNWRFSV